MFKLAFVIQSWSVRLFAEFWQVMRGHFGPVFISSEKVTIHDGYGHEKNSHWSPTVQIMDHSTVLYEAYVL
jgi:hypothetical protein